MSNMKWSDLDDRTRKIVSLLSQILEDDEYSLSAEGWVENGSNGKYGEINDANKVRFIHDGINSTLEYWAGRDGKEYRPCSLTEFAFAADLLPYVQGDMHIEYAVLLGAVIDEWELKFPECKTFGEVLAANSSAGRA